MPAIRPPATRFGNTMNMAWVMLRACAMIGRSENDERYGSPENPCPHPVIQARAGTAHDRCVLRPGST